MGASFLPHKCRGTGYSNKGIEGPLTDFNDYNNAQATIATLRLLSRNWVLDTLFPPPARRGARAGETGSSLVLAMRQVVGRIRWLREVRRQAVEDRETVHAFTQLLGAMTEREGTEDTAV